MSSAYDTGRFAEVTALDQVATRTDAAAVIQQMLADLRAHPTAWENHTLDRFLDALASSLRSIDGLYLNRGQQLPDPPTWKLLTEALIMASGYE
jgi:hypothetical protein